MLVWHCVRWEMLSPTIETKVDHYHHLKTIWFACLRLYIFLANFLHTIDVLLSPVKGLQARQTRVCTSIFWFLSISMLCSCILLVQATCCNLSIHDDLSMVLLLRGCDHHIFALHSAEEFRCRPMIAYRMVVCITSFVQMWIPIIVHGFLWKEIICIISLL